MGRRNGSAKGPLRLIAAWTGECAAGRVQVDLECGHTIWCSEGTIYRARCHRCRRAASALPGPSDADVREAVRVLQGELDRNGEALGRALAAPVPGDRS